MRIFNLSWPFSGERHVMIAMRKLGFNVSDLQCIIGHEILYSFDTGKEVFLKPSVNYYSLLESENKVASLVYRGQSFFRYIDLLVEDAFFIFLERDIDDWISDIIHSGYVSRTSIYYQIPYKDAIKLLVEEKLAHDRMVREYFRDKKNFLSCDIFNDGLSPLVTKFNGGQLSEQNAVMHIIMKAVSGRPANIIKGSSVLKKDYSYKDPKHYYFSKYNSILNDLVDFCASKKSGVNVDASIKLGVFVDYKAIGKKVSPVGRVQLTESHDYISNPGINWKYRRVASVLNDLISCGLNTDIAIDMQDSRRFGIRPAPIPRKKTITYCRRKGADSLILWPLPGYHTIGSDNFLGGYPRDTISFNSKKDIAVWRGAFSGHCSNVIDDIYENPMHKVVNEMEKEFEQGASLDNYLGILRDNIRFNFVFNFIDNVDVNARLVTDGKTDFLHHTIYGGYISSRLAVAEIYAYKYIVCLRGYDTSSNFLLAASSNSVALKEEDGWEVFYSALFKPWEHYIPLSPGGLDIDEKIKWARNNPDKVSRIISNANEICCYLSRNDLREDMCRKIVQRINSLRD